MTEQQNCLNCTHLGVNLGQPPALSHWNRTYTKSDI